MKSCTFNIVVPPNDNLVQRGFFLDSRWTQPLSFPIILTVPPDGL